MEATYFKPINTLTFETVVANRLQFYTLLIQDKTGKICLDLGEVSHCDSAGLALFIEIKKLCTLHNKIFEMRGMPKETQALAEFCGVESMLLES